MNSIHSRRVGPFVAGLVVAFGVVFAGHAVSAEAHCIRLEAHAPNNGQRGNAFELRTVNDLIIRHLEIYAYSGTNTVQIWYNPDSITMNHASWEYIGEETINPSVDGRTLVPVDIDIFVPGGETVFFCVVGLNQTMRYTNGGIADINDGNLIIDGSFGYGGSYSASNTPPISYGFSPRVFSGAVRYELVDDPHLYVTYDGWSFGCDGVRELNIGSVSDTGMQRLTIDLENIGVAEDLVLNPPFTVTVNSGSFSVGPDVGQPTSTTVEPGEGDRFIIEFEPDAGTFDFTVEIHSNDPNAPNYPVNIVGEAIAAQNLEVSLDSTAVAHNAFYNHGAVPSGTPQVIDLEMFNTGTQTLTLNSPTFDTVEIDGSYSASPDVVYSGSSTISGGSSDVGTIEFTVDQPGTFTFLVEIDTDDPLDSPFVFYVTGYGDPGELALEFDGAALAHTATLDVGTMPVDQPHSFPLELFNVGAGQLTLDPSPFAASISQGSFSDDPDVIYSGPSSIASGMSEPADLTFTLDDIGPFEFTVEVHSDDPASPYLFTIIGEGTRGFLELYFEGDLAEPDQEIDLGQTATLREISFELILQNTGVGALNFADPAFTIVNVEGEYGVEPSVESSGFSVIDVGTYEIAQLTFSLNQTVPFSFELHIHSDHPEANPYVLFISGEGAVILATASRGCAHHAASPTGTGMIGHALTALLALTLLVRLRRRP